MVAREPQVGDTEAISITEVSQEELSHYTFWRIEGCGHWFREGNLRQWYESCSDPACPSCRREFYPSEVHWVEPTQKHHLRTGVRALERLRQWQAHAMGRPFHELSDAARDLLQAWPRSTALDPWRTMLHNGVIASWHGVGNLFEVAGAMYTLSDAADAKTPGDVVAESRTPWEERMGGSLYVFDVLSRNTRKCSHVHVEKGRQVPLEHFLQAVLSERNALHALVHRGELPTPPREVAHRIHEWLRQRFAADA
jgi:hypothetical protein